ncbi:MAG: hypothetical protein A2172_04095 [Candidatus Woykebacteria bacterium RBG_13_40_15]|uniref:Fibronectin type-III domain-containing protein n=1 Tax=Candidatus Woykebacteria bacterium RBG_13_40_15 TaxID=1802593 RepID=A0A1G1W6Q5_9BACT|nr:MAG: hypothetical protein A2172_04095 [Candidatus Woykebacteria bacterium RBG_13_40_15]
MKKNLLLACLIILLVLLSFVLVFKPSDNLNTSEPNSPKGSQETLGTVSVMLTPTEDTYINSYKPTTWYGAALTVVGEYNDDPFTKKRALLKFSLSSIQTGAVINSAKLHLYQTQASGTPGWGAIAFAPASKDWNETTTWNDNITWINGYAVYQAIDTSVGWKEVDITQIVDSWYKGILNNRGLVVYSTEGSGPNWYKYFSSSEAASNKPALVVTYTLTDLTPPVISEVSTSELTKTSVKINWKTNESATSTVDYGTTTTYGATANGSTTTTHSVPLSGLAQGTTYHFRVRSKDYNNNEAISADYSFKTATDTNPGTGVEASSTPGTSNQPTSAQSATKSATKSSLKKGGATNSATKASAEKKSNYLIPALIALAVLILLLAAGGGALYYFKFRRKPKVKPSDTSNNST